MSNKLKKEDIGRVTRFLKKYSVIKKEDKLKDISDYLEKGHSSEILLVYLLFLLQNIS
jgi:hypothetical protein